MIILIWLTGLADLLLTAHGLSIGIIYEANPIMAYLFDWSLPGAVLIGMAVTTLALWGLAHYRRRVWWIEHCLVGLVLIRGVVLGLHLAWLI